MRDQIVEVLIKFWDERAIPVPPNPTTLDDLVVAIDSMSALEVLVELDDLLGMELKVGKVIRKGGYENREQFIDDLTMRVLAEVQKERP